MKKITISLLLALVSYVYGFSQNVTLQSQEEVDAFDSNITVISGKLTIDGSEGLGIPITNLNNLSNITTIAAGLEISNNYVLANIDGLFNISSINGTLKINNNPVLTNINGLSSLSNLGVGLDIKNNPVLTNINVLSNLPSSSITRVIISDNDALANIDGLSFLTSLSDKLEIARNADLGNINGLSNLSSVGGDLNISMNYVLDNIDGLSNLSSIGEDLNVSSNYILSNIDGLSNLSYLNGGLTISNNFILENLDGLSNLTSIGVRLWISYNDILLDLDGLSNLISIGGSLTIRDNESLESCCGIHYLLNTSGAIGGNTIILDNSLGCDGVTEILTLYCSYPTSTFVDGTATGNNDGSSWANAFTNLQDALTLGSNQVIRIAEGTYVPTTTSLRGASFEIPPNVNLLGGYVNGGSFRAPNSYPTVLSGEIDNITGYTGNSYHVVKIINAENVVIDGMSIEDGNADDSGSFARARGGGIYSKGSKFSLSNTSIKENRAIYGGGVFASLSPEVRIVNSEVKLNTADYGSAIFHSNATNLYLDKSRIEDNNSLVRCAIEVNNSLYTEIDNCVIANNASANANAISLVATNRNQTCIVRNTTIIGETQNKSLITMLVGYGDVMDFSIDNSIIAHQYLSFDKNVKIVNNGTLNFIHNNCYFQGANVAGNGTNTLFSDTAGDLILFSDYSIYHCSPVVNAGDNSLSFSSTDIDGNTRILDTTIDIGAYEAENVCFNPRELVEMGIIKLEPIRVYPNPTKNTLRVQTNLINPTFCLFDLLGKEILNTKAKEINLVQFPQGIYILRIMEGNELVESVKVIKD